MIADMVHIDEETMANFVQPVELEQSLHQNGPKKLQSGAGRHPETHLQWHHVMVHKEPDLVRKDHDSDKTLIYQYDLKTKWQSMYCKPPFTPRIKKARMIKSQVKAVLI